MGDVGDNFNDHKALMREIKATFGVKCPGCIAKQPKRDPTIMLPGHVCKVCGYYDQRKWEVYGKKIAELP